jgi:TorA maturation chaperone TorD
VNTATDTELGDGLLASSLAYRALSQAFAYPRPDTLAQLRDVDLPLVLAAAPWLASDVHEAFEAMRAELREVAADVLETAFCELFTHIHSADCPMYEVDYGPRDVWRQSSVLVDVAGFYRAFDVEERTERADHVAAELEFLHVVTYKRAWASARGEDGSAAVCLDAEVAFLRDHALRWIPSFAARAEALAGGSPYAAAARATRCHLRNEATRHGLEAAEDAVPQPPPPLDPHEAPAPCEADG